MSIVFQPDSTTIQFGDSQGNIPHNGVLSSNIVGTDVLPPTFPTTSTGSSLGHYHYTNSSSFALQLLNVSGSGDGGHEFWNCSNTNAPVKYFTINKTNAVLDTRLLNSTGKTVLDLTGNNLTLTSSDNRFQNSVQTYQILLTDGLSNTSTTTTPSKYQVADASINTSSTINPGLIQIGDNTDLSTLSQTQLQIGKRDSSFVTTLNETNLTIADTTNTSILSSTKLTFNNYNVKMNQVTPTLIYSSPLIYADGHEPATSLTIRNTYGYNGWYYKNSPPNNAPTNKINWYFPPAKANVTLVSDLKGISISFFNGANTSNDNCLFLTVYTVPTGSGDYAPGFFHSANTYVFNPTITPTANTNYQGVAVINKNLVPSNYETQIQYQQSTVNNPKGTYSQGDKVLAVVIGTNSAAATNSVELVVNKLNLHYDDFTQSYLLIPP
jgi:hypothetical protein